MKTVIMAGGRGTRIASIAHDIPKPMLPIEGIPILEREMECLRQQGFDDIILTVGHLGQRIVDYFGDGSGCSPPTGRPFGVKIQYYFEQEPLGNAGALFRLRDKLTEDFLLLNGDVMFDVDFHRFVAYHKRMGGLATLFAHPNSHPYDSGLLVAGADGSVAQWLAKEDARPAYYQNLVNAGLHVLHPSILARPVAGPRVDLDRDLLKPMAGSGRMFAYNSPEYVKDMGTPERYHDVCRDFSSGLVHKRNLLHKQKAIFLDRDGTLNRYVGFLRNIDEFELLPGAAEAVALINASGYLAVVITNQPVIARGEVSEEELRQIHNKMETLLGLEGAYLDGIYVCPHHPEHGFAGERPELKIVCECRKPKPGLLLQAASDLNIDLASSWMIGDSESDLLAGRAAGCKVALLTREPQNMKADVACQSVLAFAQHLFQSRKMEDQ